MEIVINEGQLSDLFFNYDHPNWNAVMGAEEDTDTPWEEIIRPDAEEFAAALGNQVDVEWLVKDFVKRV